jgi:hypothetical protein
MSSESNKINNHFDTLKIFNFKILEESKSESHVIRKQLTYQIPNCFIQTSNENVSSFIPPVKQNLKSQNEELQKLLIEVDHLEEKVGQLEFSKKIKQLKIEELRTIIERIADEDSFDNNFNCLFNTHMPQRFMPKERCTKSTTTSNHFYQQTKQRRKDSVNVTKGTESISRFEEETGDDSAGGSEDGASGDILGKNDNCKLICRWTGCCTIISSTMDNCFLFWQEHLPQQKGVLKQ